MTNSQISDVPAPAQRPAHVAIIMDGNGRWAADRGLPRLDGHRRGATVVREITTYCRELGIGYLTLFSFSTENWRRPVLEVSGLMQLLEEFCGEEYPQLVTHGIRLRAIGNLGRLPSSTQTALRLVCDKTAHHTNMTLTLAIDYGGREEITKAIRGVVHDVQSGVLSLSALDEATVSAYLDTRDIPDPDLMIRTSGELRLSNFLLWQMAYSELYFTDVRWPDFTRQHFARALQEYARRQRRFGATGEQIAEGNTWI